MRQGLLQRGLQLEYATLAWNVVGCGIVLVSAWIARSVALAGFGLSPSMAATSERATAFRQTRALAECRFPE
jgi:hypothetical protein